MIDASIACSGRRFLNGLRHIGIAVEAEAERLSIRAPGGLLTPAVRAGIRRHKAALLAASQLSWTEPHGPELPLSFEQERVWVAQQLAPRSAWFNLALGFTILGPLSIEALAQALRDIARRHEILRTVYVGGAEPAQVIKDAARVGLRIVDLADLPELARETALQCATSLESHRPFALDTDPMIRATLVRVGPRQHRLLLLRHHIAADGWSLGLLLRELVFAYAAFCLGRPAGLPAPRIQYARYAIMQRLGCDPSAAGGDLEYWREKLRGADPDIFPNAPAEQAAAGAIEHRTHPATVAQRIGAWCREFKATAFSVYLAAFLIILHHRTGRSDLLICTDYANRDSLETESLIGMFVRRLPLRCQLESGWSVVDLAKYLQRVTFDACSHGRLPLERLLSVLSTRAPGRAVPFHVMFGMHGAPAHAPYRDLKLHGTERCDLVDVAIVTNEFPLSLYVSDSASGPVSELRYDRRLFARAQAASLLRQLEAVLVSITEECNPSLQRLQTILAAADREAAVDFSKLKLQRLAQRRLDQGTRS